MSDWWLGRSEGEEIDNWNTVYSSHIQGNMSTFAYSRTLFCIYHNIYKLTSEGQEQAEKFPSI